MSGRLKRTGPGAFTRLVPVGTIALALVGWSVAPSLALSEIKREKLPPAESRQPDIAKDDAGQIPVPAEPGVTPENQEPSGETDDLPANAGDEPETMEADIPLPEIMTDLSQLPTPVRRMRELILAACLSGDIEALRPLIGTGSQITQLSLGGIEGDPVAFLREISGDGEGHEILAILQEVLEAGFVRMDEGTPHEIYVWPYFFAHPLDRLTPKQRVELFRLVTAGDYEDMKLFGGYNFYRAGITPEGQWAFFVAGD